MSRRLGDDPLIRAKNQRAKAAQASGSESGQAAVAQTETRASRASYNDVFFQRRAEAIAREQAAEAKATPERSEISEISEIPEIREVAAAPAFQSEVHFTAEAAPAPPVSIIQEAVAALNVSASGTAMQVVAPEPRVELTPPQAAQAPASGPVESTAEPQKSGGFFKRLFGKFK